MHMHTNISIPHGLERLHENERVDLYYLFSYVREPVCTLVCFELFYLFFFHLCSFPLLYYKHIILVGWSVSRSTGELIKFLYFAWKPTVKFENLSSKKKKNYERTDELIDLHSKLNIHFWFF